ncbi:hypothetical protein [Desulfobacula sp.]|nr:hypothetical protein [Desulfobacula sp.]
METAEQILNHFANDPISIVCLAAMGIVGFALYIVYLLVKQLKELINKRI